MRRSWGFHGGDISFTGAGKGVVSKEPADGSDRFRPLTGGVVVGGHHSKGAGRRLCQLLAASRNHGAAEHSLRLGVVPETMCAQMDLAHCSLTQLAEVLAKAEEEIITEWRLQATDLLRERNLNKLTLTDHLPDLVAEITRDLKLDRDGSVSAEQTRGSPPVHGVQRFHDGLDVGEVV